MTKSPCLWFLVGILLGVLILDAGFAEARDDNGIEITPQLERGDKITAVAFSPDNRTLASVGDDDTLTIWNVESGRQLRTVAEHNGITRSVGFSPSGLTVFSVGEYWRLSFWSAATGRLLRAEVNAAAFAPDGRSILSNDYDVTDGSDVTVLWDAEDGHDIFKLTDACKPAAAAFTPNGHIAALSCGDGIQLWDMRTGSKLQTGFRTSEGAYWLAFSPDGKTILAEYGGEKVILWDLETERILRVFNGRGTSRRSVAFSPDGSHIISGAADNKLVLWDIRNERELRSFSGHSASVVSIVFSADGKFIASGSEDQTAKLWDAKKGDALKTFDGHGSTVLSAEISPNGQTLLLRGYGDTRLFHIDSGEEIRTFPESYLEANSVFSPDGQTVVAYDKKNGLKLWDAGSGKELRAFTGFTSKVTSVSFSPNAFGFVAINSSNEVRLWDAGAGQVTREIKGPWTKEARLWLSPDARTVFFSSNDTTLKQWDLSSGKELNTFASSNDRIISVALSADGLFIAAVTLGLQIEIWEVKTGRHVQTIISKVKSKSGLLSDLLPLIHPPALTLSPDGKAIAIAVSDEVEVWEIRNRRLIQTIPVNEGGPYDSVNCMSFGPGNHTLVVGTTFDQDLSLWEIGGRAKRQWVAGFQANIFQCRVSPNGRSVLAAGGNGALVLFDAKDGHEVRKFSGPVGSISSIEFSLDSTRILSGREDGAVTVWGSDSAESLATFIGTEARTGSELVRSFSSGSDWLVITPRGFFAASSPAASANLANVVRGLDVYSVSQVYDSLYRPDLVQEALKGDPEGKYKDEASKLNLATILDSGSAPQIAEQAKTELIGDSAKVSLRLTDTGGGVGEKLVWRVNGVTQGAVQTASAQTTAGDGYRIVSQTLQVDPTHRNVVEITAYNGKGLLASLPYRVEIDKFGETKPTERPRMFVVAVGVSNYVRTDWSLQYAATDAIAIGDRLREVAKPLYAESKVVPPVLEGAATAKGIETAIDSIAGEVKPADVFVLYIAGHGRSIAGDYYFLPQDLTFEGGQKIENAAVSQDMLQKWLAKIPAQKSILILDTCESASAVRGVEQETAIDRLQHALGRSVITAASDAAHEGYEGHGLLTGVILDALTKTGADDSDEVTLQQVANYASDHVPQISQQVWGERQQPHVRLGDDFPLGVRVAAVAQPETAETIPKTPTHVLVRAERVREQATDDAPGAQTLPTYTAVRVVKIVGDYSIVARGGVKLGYVPSEALAKLQ
ncbi:caspase family protein (plasmid) [Rhizobium leguminosarum]